jgi:hypothetical protein
MTEDIKRFEERSVVKTEPAPISIMELAITKNMDIDQIQKLMEMQKEIDAYQAKKAYVSAMTAFKANPPKITKDKHVQFNKTEYTHASLGNVTEIINSKLAEHGLSASWSTHQADAIIEVTCTIMHSLGHCERTTLKASPDQSGGKNNIQAIGSTISYLQRYTLLSLTGLATHDQDDDGIKSDQKYIDKEQFDVLVDMINEVEADEEKFLKYMKVDILEDILDRDFNRAIAALQAKKNG